ncbi:hypothetical protein [Lelliottia wanjuensis]|uniref:hypothetical protein n=1 Tax=Lelliottia wanjuensis TaxID=3050585 RepID=UPI00254F5532|nr:hypothetical protein [Lelliottia sp. V86_10]MDK9585804.1 hypothetical protein [Lelliottia sp. V86_10]
MSIKRYSAGYRDSDGYRYLSMLEKDDGGYVRHEDYAESERYGRAADITIENLLRKVEQLAAENAGLKGAGI